MTVKYLLVNSVKISSISLKARRRRAISGLSFCGSPSMGVFYREKYFDLMERAKAMKPLNRFHRLN
ncbi:hypothetical protein BBR01nite_56370 [Brevibacillus brevis]|nr:hypothetical protein BBR01nite_56370 [Brevibacillus brevis]